MPGKLKPATVKKRILATNRRINELAKEIKMLRAACSHQGSVESFHEYEDSGFQCSACGTCWRRWPEGVE